MTWIQVHDIDCFVKRLISMATRLATRQIFGEKTPRFSSIQFSSHQSTHFNSSSFSGVGYPKPYLQDKALKQNC